MLVTAAVLIGIGYTNFSSKSPISNEISKNTLLVNSNTIGDVQLVSSSAAIVENEDDTSSIVSNDTAVTVSNNNDTNSFSELKMERDEMYSKNIEVYQRIIDSKEISNEQKSIAIQEIEKITNLQNAIQISEELIKLKGFDDVVIYSSNDKISVTVRAVVLSDSQVAQIQNIISKELEVEVSDITISNK